MDDAVADTDQLASSDVERAFAAGCGGALDGHDVSVANGDVEQLGAEGTPGQRSRLRQEVVADLSPSAVFARLLPGRCQSASGAKQCSAATKSTSATAS